MNNKAGTRGLGPARVIVSGCHGELSTTGGVTPRWICWSVSPTFFLYIVSEFVAGLPAATKAEENESWADMLERTKPVVPRIAIPKEE